MSSSTAIIYSFVALFLAVQSAPVQQELPVSIPFYGILHPNGSYNGRPSNMLRKEIIRLNGIAEHYIELQKDQKTCNFLLSVESDINMESVTLTPVEDQKIIVESTLKPSFYDSLRLIRSDCDVSLGFASPPSLHSADVVVSSGNQLVPYYLKQINIKLHKEERNQTLEVDSLFIRRDVDVSEAAGHKQGLIVVMSVWNYTLETSSLGYTSFELHNFSSEAFFSVGTEPSTTTETQMEPLKDTSNLTGSFVTFILSTLFVLLI